MGKLKIGFGTYTSNWVVSDTRDALGLEILWHVTNNPQTYYVDRVVKANGDF